MARWNNGYTQVSGPLLKSKLNLPEDASNEQTLDDYDFYGRAIRRRRDVYLSRGRFTARRNASYVLTVPDDNLKERGSTEYAYVDYPGAAFSVGGDLRDINALGGGIPDVKETSIGLAKPGRLSPFSRNQAVQQDHASPVKRLLR